MATISWPTPFRRRPRPARRVRSRAYAELFGAPAPGGTALLPAGTGLGEALAAAISVWSSGDTLVVLGDGVQATEHLRETERVQRTLGAGDAGDAEIGAGTAGN